MSTPGTDAGRLAGRRIVITRAAEQAGQLRSLLEAEGATVVEVPTISVADPPDGGAALRAALADAWDWVVVTSRNGAQRAVVAAERAHRWAVVGPGTAAELEALGVVPALVPERFVAEGLLAVFPPPPEDRPGRVLLAQAEAARPVLAEGLRRQGWEVTGVVAYRTIPSTPPAAVVSAARSADAIVFTSGSTVDGFVAAVGGPDVPEPVVPGPPAPGPVVPGPIVVAIGPVTAAAAARHGLAVARVADPHTLQGLVTATVEALG